MEFHDPLESCPYNIFHRIRRSRMQFHITTCAQNHRHLTGMVQCPFDARHVVKHIEFEHHKSTCPARASVIDYAIHDTSLHAKLKVLPIDVEPVGRWDEKWDDDPDVKTYDPIQYIKNKPIVYSLIGVSKAKRKDHRLRERIRYNRVVENGGIDLSPNRYYSRPKSTSSKPNTKTKVVYEIGDGTDEGKKPLRPPSNFLTNCSTDKTFHNYARQTSESSGYTDPKVSTSSKIDESSVRSSSSVVALSSSQRTSSSRKSSDDQWVSGKSSGDIDVNAVKNRNQEVRSIHVKGSIVSSEDSYQFNHYQSKDQEKFSTPNTDNIASSEDDYQFNQYHSKDQKKFSTSNASSIVSSKDDDQFVAYQAKDREKFPTSDKNSTVSSMDNYRFVSYRAKDQEKIPTSDASSIVSSMDDYRFIPYQSKNQEKIPTSDTNSIVSSKDNYQFVQYQPNYEENSSISDTDSSVSSNDDYQLHPNKYTEQRKCSMSDTISVISGKGKYQLYQHHLKDQGKFSILDTVSVASSKDKYQYSRPLARTSSETSLSSSFSETSEIDSVFSCEDDVSIIQSLSKTIEKPAENDKNNIEFPITDTVYNVSSESQCIMTMMNGNSDLSPLSSEETEHLNYPLSNGIDHSREQSINSIETNSANDVSIFDKLSKTIEELAMDSKDYKKKSESLDQEINKLKKLPSNSKSRQTSAPVNLKKGKLFPKCAANFLNLKE